MSWYDLKGAVKTFSGTSGTCTFPSGSRILQIVFSGGTMTIPTGDGSTLQTVTGVAGQFWYLEEHHASRVLQGASGSSQLQIVFTGTASYFVEYVGPAGAS